MGNFVCLLLIDKARAKDKTYECRCDERLKTKAEESICLTYTVGNAIDSGMGLSITIDKLRVFINKTLSILSAYQ